MKENRLKIILLIIQLLIVTSMSRRPIGGIIKEEMTSYKKPKYKSSLRYPDRTKFNYNRKLSKEENSEEGSREYSDKDFEEILNDDNESHRDENKEHEEDLSENEEDAESEESIEMGDGTSIEDKIVVEELEKIEYNLRIFTDLIIKCIENRYATNMFMDKGLVEKACLGPGYEILERTYQNDLKKLHLVFDPIFRHKVHMYRKEYQEDILLFFKLVKMIALKDLKMRETLETAHDKINLTMDKKSFELIVKDISIEVDAYDEFRGKLIANKDKIHEYLDEREKEKEAAKAEIEENEEAVESDTHILPGAPEEEDDEFSIEEHDLDDGYEEDHPGLEEASEEEEEESEHIESEESSPAPIDERDDYDPEAASVGPEGESPEINSEDSEYKREQLGIDEEEDEEAVLHEDKADRVNDFLQEGT